MPDLVPIKMLIPRNKEGKHQHPDFNSLQVVKDSGCPSWSAYLKVYGSNMMYDHKCGHDEEDAESPFGEWYGMALVPKEFAQQAVAAFPGVVVVLTEAEAETFYNTRHNVRMPDELVTPDILMGLFLRQQLGIALPSNAADMLNPESNTRGIRRNKKKLWADYRQAAGIKIIGL